jgi:hypothetical protein
MEMRKTPIVKIPTLHFLKLVVCKLWYSILRMMICIHLRIKYTVATMYKTVNKERSMILKVIRYEEPKARWLKRTNKIQLAMNIVAKNIVRITK